jgi:3-isopropylmalate dehydrogenase
LVIARENSEGFYADRNMYDGSGEFMPTPDLALAVAVVTRPAVERIAHVAFQLARDRRKHVTVVHKANVLKMTTGLFRDICLDVGQTYEDVMIDDFHIDAMMSHMIKDADLFDVIVTENMFGDILSNLAAEIAGSLGMAASLNRSETQAMAQAAHGSAPDLGGKNVANPIGMILSTALLLAWLAVRRNDAVLHRLSRDIESAVSEAIRRGYSTADLGGTASTSDFTDQVGAVVQEMAKS